MSSEPEPADLPRAPWSVIREDFIRQWGYPDGKFDPEHLEILGPSGSGKTYAEATFLQERVARRGSAVIFVATKPVDATISALGWPVVSDFKALMRHFERGEKQVIFWPRTDQLGKAWTAYMAAKIEDLLSRLWQKKMPVILVFDEIATSEALSVDVREIIKRFWREARSVGITIIAMKQRPQGIQRDMHSETAWIAAFKPKDEEDAIRVAQIMGSKRMWMPILMNLNRDAHEFVLLHVPTGDAVVTWIDIPLKPADTPKRTLYGKVS
jgi:KaiC/GvpD/RAD55 family RecA-like ATPase